ncbi:MAG: DUF4386 domain-containing protein [FCB group bacterium]|nr:DUF4386 domain-containing protein [FCB group bacterium]
MSVGIAFIISTITGVISVLLLDPVLNAPDFLTRVNANGNQIILGAVLELVCAAAFIMVAILIYPVLKQLSQRIARVYVIGRSFEAVPFILGVTGLLVLLTVSQEAALTEGVSDSAHLKTIGGLLMAVRDWSNLLGARLFCGIAALPFYYLLFRINLIPRFISIWGLLGTLLYMTAATLIMYGLNPLSTAAVIMTLPFAVNEMVLAVWLIAKGFNPSALPASTVS